MLDEPGSTGVHEQRGGLHAGEVGGRDDARGGIDQTHVEGEDVAGLEELGLAVRDGVAIGTRRFER